MTFNKVLSTSHIDNGGMHHAQVKNMIDKIKISKVKVMGPKKVLLKNQIADAMHINKILAYSAKKIIANKAPVNSILKPDTISDSPSAKSNGARFVSATVLVNHTPASGIIKTVIGKEIEEASSQEQVFNKKTGNNKTKSILTS